MHLLCLHLAHFAQYRSRVTYNSKIALQMPKPVPLYSIPTWRSPYKNIWQTSKIHTITPQKSTLFDNARMSCTRRLMPPSPRRISMHAASMFAPCDCILRHSLLRLGWQVQMDPGKLRSVDVPTPTYTWRILMSMTHTRARRVPRYCLTVLRSLSFRFAFFFKDTDMSSCLWLDSNLFADEDWKGNPSIGLYTFWIVQ